MNTTLRSLAAACMAVVLVCTAGAAFAGGSGHKLPRPMANFSLSREFYLTFPTNLHEGSGPLDLTCFIASNYKTKGTIELLGPGKTIIWKQKFTVDSMGVAQIMVPHGFNNYAEIQDLEDEKPLRKAIHIIADNPIVVYGLNHWPFTTDGYLAIPPAGWGTNYRVASYYGITRTDEYPTIRATSQFAVVAAYDNTVVNIILTDATMNGNGVKTHDKNTNVSIVLNKGEVYQMQALKTPNVLNDLTGTEIQSNKPIGVLAGVKCTDVPKTKPACDHILEMLPPTQTWGKEYFTYPFDLQRNGGDTWRVIPMEPGTEVFINGNDIATISPTDPVTPFYETDDLTRPELRTAAHWTFSKPVLVCQYINGQTYDNSDHGDPSYVVLETRENFETGVVFATPPDSNGFTNYINVLINDSAGTKTGMRDSLYLDGSPIKNLPSGNYLVERSAQVPGTSFWAFHIKIPGGAHRLRAQSEFSAYAVGYKNFESYAWACALALKIVGSVDTVAPIMPINLKCGEQTELLKDLPDDVVRTNLPQLGTNGSGIGWLYQEGKDSTYNFDSTVVNDSLFTPGDSSTMVHIKVTNLRNNAHGALFATDRAGNDTVFYFDYIADTVTATPGVRLFGKVNAGSTRTDSIVIANPLAQDVKVDSIWLEKNTVFKFVPALTLPFTLKPGQKKTLIIKYSPLVDGFDEDTLMVKFDCFSRFLARVAGGSGTPCIATPDIDFGTLILVAGTAQLDSSLTISNPGSDTLVITQMAIAGGAGSAFKVLNPTLPLVTPVRIIPGDSLPVQIRFTATAQITYTDSLVVTSNATCSTRDNIGRLIGRAQAPGPFIRPDTLTTRVACRMTMPRGITVGNLGSSADVLDSLLIVGGNINDFQILGGPKLGLTIPPAPAAPLTVVVNFTPSDTGARMGVIRARFTSGSVLFDTLRGTGIHPLIASQDVDFGTQVVGRNVDSFAVALNVPKRYIDKLEINNITITGGNASDFTFINKNAPYTLAAGGDTMQTLVRFTPSAGGLRTTTLTFVHDGTFGVCKTDTNYAIRLSGIGTVPGITVTDWDAQRVFITTTEVGNVVVTNPGTSAVTVDSLQLTGGKNFAIDYAPGRTPRTFVLGPSGTQPVYLKFTPADTIFYNDTLVVYNTSNTPRVFGFVKGVGKVVIYTASVPLGIHGTFGMEAQVPVRILTAGYTRPSAIDPGDYTPLDSGAITSMRIGLQYDRSVMQALTTDNSVVQLGGAITSGATVTRIPSARDSVVFDLTGMPALRDSGLLATVRFRALYSATPGSALRDTVSSPTPWVIWKMVPGLFFLDSICGLGANLKVRYVGGAALEQSVPNPAIQANGQASVNIPFALDREMNVRLCVYNAMGAEIARLVDSPLPRGAYAAPFDLRGIAAGMYYYRLIANGNVQTRTMIIEH